LRSSTVVLRGKETGTGSLIEELRRREDAARAEAGRLRSRIEELSGDLARAEERASRLAIALEEVTRVMEETVPPWQEGSDASVLPRVHQDLLEVAADAGRPLLRPAASVTIIESCVMPGLLGCTACHCRRATTSGDSAAGCACREPVIAAVRPFPGIPGCSAHCAGKDTGSGSSPTRRGVPLL
jgi:hypothetical protein